MTTLKTISTTFVLFLFFCSISQAQHVVNIPNIDLIAYTNNTFMLYEQLDLNIFKEIDIEYSSSNHGFKKIKIDRDGFTYSLEQLESRFKTVVFIGHLRSNGFEDLKNKQWLIKTKRVRSNERHIFKFTNKNLATYQEFENFMFDGSQEKYQTPYKVIHGFMMDQKPILSVSSWSNIDQIWYLPIILDFGNAKQIILLNNHIDSDFVFIPLMMDEIKLISEEIDVKEIVQIQENSTSFSPYDYFDHFKFLRMYKKIKEGKKYRLFDHFGNDLLGKTFDQINYNKHFIIGESDGKFTVFDPLLSEVIFPNMQKYYFNEYGLEILTKKEAYYIVEGFCNKTYPVKIGGNIMEDNKKVAVFPEHKKAIYESLEKVTTNFYKIIKNGKSGWLDIKTMKEYFFD